MRCFSILQKALLLLLLLALMAVVLLQVYARLFLPKAPSWTEELARMVLLFVVALGAGVTWRAGMFVNVDLLHLAVRGRIKLLLNLICHLVVATTSLLMALNSVGMLQMGVKQTSAALGLPMVLVFITMTILPLNVLWAQGCQVYQYWRARGKR